MCVMRTCCRCEGSDMMQDGAGVRTACTTCNGTGQVTCTPDMLADEYTAVLREWFEKEPEVLQEIDRRNAAEDDPNICHEGDFCDHNQAILDALENLGIEWGGAEDAPCNELIALARRICRDRGFAPTGTKGGAH